MFSNNFDVRQILVYQCIFLTSFSTRLYIVKNVFQNLDRVYRHNLLFNSYDKLSLAISLRNYRLFSLCEISLVRVLNNFGMSYKFPFIGLYDICLDSLIGSSLFPILESKMDRSYYKLRPYKQEHDFLFSLHNSLVSKSKLTFSFFSDINLFPLLNSEINLLNLREFPLHKMFLLNFVKFCNICYLRGYFPSLFYNFFDFIFSGLVRFGICI
jgi:hypothetical protein